MFYSPGRVRFAAPEAERLQGKASAECDADCMVGRKSRVIGSYEGGRRGGGGGTRTRSLGRREMSVSSGRALF